MDPVLHANMTRLFNPRHIAFIGGRDAEVAMHEAARIGFSGQIWPVNPRRPTLGGHRCFASVHDLPEPPDAVFLAVPAAAAVETVDMLRQNGAGGIVCYTAGFREAGADGQAKERALIKAAGDMALVGPNCYGIINYLDRSALWPFAHGGTPANPQKGGAAILTQSGMLSSDITMSQRSLPLTHMVSAGNQSVLRLEHFVDYLSSHPAVRAIGLHIEGLGDVAAFGAAAERAIRRGVPLVVLKTGSSQIGAALTVSHTGSLSGADDLYNALFERCGILRVKSPAELLETLKFLCVAGVPRGNRVAGFTCSGGGATMLADHAESIGLDFPGFDAAASSTLAALLPQIATVSNPLDYTTPIWGDATRTGPVFSSAMDLARADAAVLVQDYPAAGLDESKPAYLADAGAFVAAAKGRGIPAAICATLPENLDADTRSFLIGQDIAPMQGLPETLNAMRAAIRWGAARERFMTAPPTPLLATIQSPASPHSVMMLDEAEGKDWLAKAGLPVPSGQTVASKDVCAAASALGYPVALKMLGPRLAHKSEAGAVVLGLDSPAAVAQGLAQMQSAVKAHDPAALTDRFLVEQMAPKPVAELLVSLRHDPQFGPALTLGAGGVLVELLADTATLLLPATPNDITCALQSLRILRVLSGYRGARPADLGALVAVIHDLTVAFLGASPSLQEIEINPLFACADGVFIVDALIYKTAPP